MEPLKNELLKTETLIKKRNVNIIKKKYDLIISSYDFVKLNSLLVVSKHWKTNIQQRFFSEGEGTSKSKITYLPTEQSHKRKELCLIQQNVQSLPTALINLQLCINANNADLVTITEQWRSEEEITKCCLEGYVLTSSFCLQRGRHGGSAI
ncbi:hypothetical protein WA026_015108 [Henosepilachna vigintioctopunctata]|uniref:Uncharacterized protein n=1 Tax=Henosepilachna vigintioctopunctata TaxID=420089 RepID=A0AAW1TUT6_9CUCU